jgi:DNA-binding NarL/FixJ family response regulator
MEDNNGIDRGIHSVTRVVLADDHIAFRDLFHLNLERLGGYEVVGETADGREVFELCSTLNPDVLVYDFYMPGVCGLELLRRLCDELPQVRVLVITGCQQKEVLSEICRMPVAGYVPKAGSIRLINLALESVAAGGYFRGKLPPLPADSDPVSPESLTPREREVLRLIATGFSTKEISHQIGVSVKTVDHHRTHLMNKLNIHDVVKLTRFALRCGIAELD